MRKAFLAFLPFPLLAMPAAAQEADDPYAACAAIPDAAARLACFDSTYAEQTVLAAEREEREEARRAEVFGFREAEAASEDDAEEFAVTVTVTDVLSNSRRDQILLMENGQLWREIDGSTMRNRVRNGWTGTITRHWSGAYEIRFDGRPGYLRVARMR